MTFNNIENLNIKTSDAYKSNSNYVDKTGCHHETLEDLIQIGLLDFCGCGMPEENLLYILSGLELLEEKTTKLSLSQDTTDWWKEWEAKSLQHHGNSQAQYFFYYWLDREDYTEHGGSVPGWISNKGKELLSLLKEWKYDLH